MLITILLNLLSLRLLQLVLFFALLIIYHITVVMTKIYIKIMNWNILLLFYISCRENVPKQGVHFLWKDILCELLGWKLGLHLTYVLKANILWFQYLANWTKIVLWTNCWWNLQTVYILISSYNGLFRYEKKYFVMV